MAADTNPEDLQGGARPGGSPDDRYERSDARVSAVLMVMFVLFAAAVLTAMAVLVYYRYAVAAAEQTEREGRAPLTERPLQTHFQGPSNLQVNTKLDMDLYRMKAEEQLNSYGWVSREAGVVHIPIDRAMALVLERGLPTRPAAAAAAFADQATSAPQDSSAGRTYRNSMR